MENLIEIENAFFLFLPRPVCFANPFILSFFHFFYPLFSYQPSSLLLSFPRAVWLLSQPGGMPRLFDQVFIICDSVTLVCWEGSGGGLMEKRGPPCARGLSTQDWAVTRHPVSVNERHPHPARSPGSLHQVECSAPVTHSIAEGY